MPPMPNLLPMPNIDLSALPLPMPLPMPNMDTNLNMNTSLNDKTNVTPKDTPAKPFKFNTNAKEFMP